MDKFRSALEEAYRAVDDIEQERDVLRSKLRDAIPLLSTGDVTPDDIAAADHELGWLANGLVRRRLEAARDEADTLDAMTFTNSDRFPRVGSVSH